MGKSQTKSPLQLKQLVFHKEPRNEQQPEPVLRVLTKNKTCLATHRIDFV